MVISFSAGFSYSVLMWPRFAVYREPRNIGATVTEYTPGKGNEKRLCSLHPSWWLPGGPSSGWVGGKKILLWAAPNEECSAKSMFTLRTYPYAAPDSGDPPPLVFKLSSSETSYTIKPWLDLMQIPWTSQKMAKKSPFWKAGFSPMFLNNGWKGTFPPLMPTAHAQWIPKQTKHLQKTSKKLDKWFSCHYKCTR